MKLQFPSKECAQGRHSECTETADTCNCTCRGGHKTPHRYAETEGDTRELKAALLKYGKHLTACACFDEFDEKACDCGFGEYELG